MAPRTAKLVTLPMAKPPTRQNCAIVAAISTCSFFSLVFISSEVAAIIQVVDVYPLEMPNRRRTKRYIASELIKGVVRGADGSESSGR